MMSRKRLDGLSAFCRDPNLPPKNQGGRFRVPLHQRWKANYFFLAVFFAGFFAAFFAAFFVAIAILPFDH
jgi:hypothetical protein